MNGFWGWRRPWKQPRAGDPSSRRRLPPPATARTTHPAHRRSGGTGDFLRPDPNGRPDLARVEVGKARTRWPVSTYPQVVPGVSGRVLVVDDNKVIRQLIRVNLELEGFEVVTAADGAECLEVVHQVRPDVVTLDVAMPRLDGLRAAARLRADPRTRDLPLAIISACTQYEVEAGLDVGVDAFLAKPFDPSELVSLVRKLAERERGSASFESALGPCGPLGPVGSLGAPGETERAGWSAGG